MTKRITTLVLALVLLLSLPGCGGRAQEPSTTLRMPPIS